MLVVGACSRSEPALIDSDLAVLDSLCLTAPPSNSSEYLLWGKYETSNGEYFSNSEMDDSDLPVVNVSFHQAQAWCHEHGLRLPSVSEWATALENAVSVSNVLELGINRSLPGGVFERGRTDSGMYDMAGNVREFALADELWTAPETHAFALGSSFATYKQDGYVANLSVNKSDRASDMGFRYMTEASTFIENHVAPKWNTLNATQRRQAVHAIAKWSKPWRRALADDIDQQAVPSSLMKALQE
jgi:hypothetical protein